MTKTTTGIIIKIISNDFTVLDELNNIHVCKARGKFRNLKITPLVGDNVVIDIENNYILEVKKRRNELVRPSVSNIDQLFIITSVKHPNFDTNLLDKLLCIAEFNCIKPIICLTKVDLLNKEEFNDLESYIKYYKNVKSENKSIRKGTVHSSKSHIECDFGKEGRIKRKCKKTITQFSRAANGLFN